MAATPTTLQTLLTATRQRCNMENNQFVTDAELTTYLNQDLSRLDAILVSKNDRYKVGAFIATPVLQSLPQTASASALGGTGQVAAIAMPADFMKLLACEVQYNTSSPDGFATVRKTSFQLRNNKPYPLTNPIGYGPYQMEYYLADKLVVIIPSSIATQWPYRIWYVPDYVPLVLTTDTLQTYMDTQYWHEYAIVGTCAKVLAKQDLDPTTFLAQKAELAEIITDLATPARDKAEPISVIDTRGLGNGGGYGWDW